MINTLVTARCSEQVIALIDKVGKMYGMSRAELMRTGAIHYCQQLLLTDTMEQINDLCQSISSEKLLDKDKDTLQALDQLTKTLLKLSGNK